KVLIEERMPIERELYAAVLNDPASQGPLVMFSTAGGMDIEEMAATAPDRLHLRPVDIRRGLTHADAATLVQGLALGAAEGKVADTLARLYEVYAAYDAELVEINPLIVTTDGRVVALDCKFVMDDSAIVRQSGVARAGTPEKLTSLEARAKAAGAAKVNFVDLGGSTAIVLKELTLDKAAKKAGVGVVPDVGLGPGMTNIIAAHAIASLDRADEVLIRDGGLPQDPRPPMNYLLTFSEHGLINEYVGEGTALKDGKLVKVRGCSEVEPIALPGLGLCEAGHAAGGLSTMARTFAGKVRTLDNKFVRYPGHMNVVNTLSAMGFFDLKPIRVGKAMVSPRALSAELFRRHFDRPGEKDIVVIRVTATGVKDRRPARVVYDMTDLYDDTHEMTAMMRTTGFPAAIVARMLADGRIPPGAHTVEAGVPAEAFFDEIRARGFALRRRFDWL
ncbi:MAG: saccharopine dehydrogenase C-terminal domain-containing protein, partial [Elusimicrobiota bacterium]